MIAAAHEALARGDARAALEHLLAAWREVPAIDLAEAIEAVGLFAARGVHAPVGATAADRDERWFAEARRGDPVMRQRLLETVSDTSGAVAKVGRAKVLAEAARDPRTAMRLVALATEPYMPHAEAFSTVWNPLFQMLARSGDPRVRRAIEHAPWHQIVRGTKLQREAFHKRLAKYGAQLAQAFPAPPPAPSDDDARRLYEIITMARAPADTDARDREIAAGLLAAVHAAPGDPGVRAIYADWLQERGDPRGEFIALQLAHPKAMPPEILQRTRELLAQHRSTWLGEVEPFVKYASFRGGFLDELTVHDTDVPPDPTWSTVRIVRGGVPASDAHPMPILSSALAIDHRGLRALASLANPPPLVSLEWEGSAPDRDGEAVADFAALLPRIPTLRRFSIRGTGAERLAWAWRASTIRELVVDAPSERLAHWLEAAVAEQLGTVEVVHDGWRTTLLASGELVAKQGYSGNFAVVLPHLVAALERVADHISRVEITVSAKHEWRMPERRLLASLLERHPRWADGARLYGYVKPVGA